MSPPPTVTLFTRNACHLCDTARFVIERVGRDIEFTFQIVNVDETTQTQWRERYHHHVPVVHVDGVEHARHRVDEPQLRKVLADASRADT